LFKSAVKALNKGGALTIVDEWAPPPSRVNEKMSKPRMVRKFGWEFDGIMQFEVSLREHIQKGRDNGLYAYVFRKVND
jgi:hypothetical protein